MAEGRTIHAVKKLVVDGVFLAGLLLCLLAVDKLWHPFKRGFFCEDETLMYPYHTDTVTVLMLRAVGLGLPLFTFLVCEWASLRGVRDGWAVFGARVPAWARGFYCVAVSFCAGVCFTELTVNIAKNTVGRLRPHFFAVCQPSVDCDSASWKGRYIQPFEYNCTGEQVEDFRNMRMSFLSGHSAWAAFTMLYLALYLERRLSGRSSHLPRQAFQFFALMLSWFTALSRVSDYKHHWSDVVAGYILGIVYACIAWNWGTDLLPEKKQERPSLHQEMNSNKNNQNTTYT